MTEQALIIDEDPGLLALLRFGLEQDGFTVVTEENGSDALKTAYDHHPDVIILGNVNGPTDGCAICRRLRYMSDVPIIMLSSKTEERDVIEGLTLGADEYVTKPCSLEELKARVRALLRRATMVRKRGWEPAYQDGNLRVDLANGTVTRNGEVVHLTPTESRLLMCLVSRRGEVIPHKELLVQAWGPEYSEAVGYLGVYIRYLRQKVEKDPSHPQYIRTRWGIGYYFAGEWASLAEQ